MSIDGRVIAVILTLILVCLGFMFGFGYLYGISTFQSENKITNLKEKTSLDEAKDKIALIVNGSIREQFEENYDKCNKYNSNYKNIVNILLDFMCDEDGQFSKYFKSEDEFDDSFIDLDLGKKNYLSDFRDLGVSKEKISSNNKIIIDKTREFRNKINNVQKIDYYKLFKEYFFDRTEPENYGKILVQVAISKPLKDLSETDIDNMASMMIGILLGFMFHPIFEESDSLDYTVYFYDKQSDEIRYHQDFVNMQNKNAEFIETNEINAYAEDLKKATENKRRAMRMGEDVKKIYQDDIDTIKKSIIEKIKTKKNITQQEEQDIQRNINNIQMEALFIEMNLLQQVKNKKVTIFLKDEIKSGKFGGIEIDPNEAGRYSKGSKFNTSSYYNKIDSLNEDNMPYCS